MKLQTQNAKHKDCKKATENGRSMVEMLGVLAIIGVLSVGGIAGYKSAITKHRANELLNEVSKRAVVISGQLLTGQEPDISAFGVNNNIGGVGVGLTASGPVDGFFAIFTTGSVEKDVCDKVAATITDNSAIRMLESGSTEVVSGGTQSGECTTGALTFTFNSDLSLVGGGYISHKDADDENKCEAGFYPYPQCNKSCSGNTRVNADGTGCECKPGYKGTDCNECNTGYGKDSDDKCVVCPANSANDGDTSQETDITGCYCNSGYEWDSTECKVSCPAYSIAVGSACCLTGSGQGLQEYPDETRKVTDVCKDHFELTCETSDDATDCCWSGGYSQLYQTTTEACCTSQYGALGTYNGKTYCCDWNPSEYWATDIMDDGITRGEICCNVWAQHYEMTLAEFATGGDAETYCKQYANPCYGQANGTSCSGSTDGVCYDGECLILQDNNCPNTEDENLCASFDSSSYGSGSGCGYDQSSNACLPFADENHLCFDDNGSCAGSGEAENGMMGTVRYECRDEGYGCHAVLVDSYDNVSWAKIPLGIYGQSVCKQYSTNHFYKNDICYADGGRPQGECPDYSFGQEVCESHNGDYCQWDSDSNMCLYFPSPFVCPYVYSEEQSICDNYDNCVFLDHEDANFSYCSLDICTSTKGPDGYVSEKCCSEAAQSLYGEYVKVDDYTAWCCVGGIDYDSGEPNYDCCENKYSYYNGTSRGFTCCINVDDKWVSASEYQGGSVDNLTTPDDCVGL